MTKEQEIAILQRAAQELGANSYCGPWLAQQVGAIEADLKSDFFPQHSRAEAIQDCQTLTHEAMDSARQLREGAAIDAKRLIDDARKDANGIRERAASALRSALKSIEA